MKSINFDNHRSWITEQIEVHHRPILSVHTELQQRCATSFNIRTLYRRLKLWNINHQSVRTVDNEQLRTRLEDLFFENGLSDNELLEALQEEGFQVSLNGLRDIRKKCGIFRRLDQAQIETAQQKLREWFIQERVTTNAARNLGRGMLSVHVRQQRVPIARRHLRQIYGEFHQDSIDFRRSKAFRRRQGFTVPSPN